MLIKLTAAQHEQIIDLCQKNIVPSQIATQFGVTDTYIRKLARRHGISFAKRVSQAQIDEMIKDYTAGISSEIIAQKLGLDGATVCRNLKKAGIKIRPASQNKRRYSIIGDYFKTINTEDRAYFLGLMYADGNMHKSKRSIKIGLQEKDRDILEKFSIAIYNYIRPMAKETRTLQDGTIRNYLTLPVYSSAMCQDLIKLGCPPAKTFVIRFPTTQIIPQNLLYHFVRGYFDGDGSISIVNPSRPVVDISSNVIFIEELIEFLTNQGLRCGKLVRNKENPLSAQVQLTSTDNVINFYNYIYNNSTVHMNRKYNTFQDLFRLLNDKRINKDIKTSNIEKYGTTYIPEYNGQILYAENVKKLSAEEKEKVIDFLFNFYRKHGFPHAQLTDDELIKDFTSLKNIDPCSIDKEHVLTTQHASGVKIFKHFSPHFYEVNSGTRNNKLSMVDTFNNDELLKRVIKNRLDHGMNMTGNMLKQGLPNSKVAYKASTFNPMVAKFMYAKFTKENDIIYDYSMGFGQRLTAALSIPHALTYVGVDPIQKTVDSNNAIFSFFRNNVPFFNKKAEIVCIGSENFCDPRYIGQIALAYSCPPYFNLEKYEDSPTQAYSNGYNQFINVWWRNTVLNILKLLRNDGIFALEIKDTIDGFNIGEDMSNMIRSYGFQLIDTYQVRLTRNVVFGNAKGSYKYEPIYIFRKN